MTFLTISLSLNPGLVILQGKCETYSVFNLPCAVHVVDIVGGEVVGGEISIGISKDGAITFARVGIGSSVHRCCY